MYSNNNENLPKMRCILLKKTTKKRPEGEINKWRRETNTRRKKRITEAKNFTNDVSRRMFNGCLCCRKSSTGSFYTGLPFIFYFFFFSYLCGTHLAPPPLSVVVKPNTESINRGGVGGRKERERKMWVRSGRILLVMTSYSATFLCPPFFFFHQDVVLHSRAGSLSPDFRFTFFQSRSLSPVFQIESSKRVTHY